LTQLYNTFAAKIVDYRSGEISVPDAAHVERWINQFDAPNRIPILNEMLHLIDKVYSRDLCKINITYNKRDENRELFCNRGSVYDFHVYTT
jgi:hypothetical protein